MNFLGAGTPREWQKVTDTLRAVEHDAETLKAQAAALAAADQALQLVQTN
jgi:hypothetical protein